MPLAVPGALRGLAGARLGRIGSMTILRRTLAALIACLGTGALLGVSVQSPTSAGAVDEPCTGHGPIPASALAGGVSLGCSLVGRTVYDGHVAVVVPPAGVSVAGDGYGTHGEVVGLQVSNTGTGVVATAGAPSRPSGAVAARTARAADPAACKDRTFHLEGHTWKTSLRYGINLGKAPARLGGKTLVRQIKAANANMRTGRNTCGRSTLGTPASRYAGRTHTAPNIKPGRTSITCGGFNTTNVVGFGNLPGDLLGWTCFWWDGTGRMAAADIMLDSGSRLVTRIPAGCTNKWDLEGTVTHEFGHAYGMGHAGSGHSNLTMSHAERPCSTYGRTLGLGDWLGMKKMYGTR
jgi:hypothetical protein